MDFNKDFLMRFGAKVLARWTDEITRDSVFVSEFGSTKLILGLFFAEIGLIFRFRLWVATCAEG